jgi:hypothetical protein
VDSRHLRTIGEIEAVAQELQEEIERFIHNLPSHLTVVQKEEMNRLARIMTGSLRHAHEHYNVCMAEIEACRTNWHPSTVDVRLEQALAAYRSNVQTNRLRLTSLRTTFILFNPPKK